MEQIISGLLIQKASSRPPEPGEERWFSWETKQGKSGKPYIKIKNDTEEYGGKLCSIIDAEKTDFVDKHGNVSYNVGFEPVNPNGDTPRKPSELRRVMKQDDDFVPMTHGSKGEALPGVDEAKAHIMQAVNLYNLCVDAVDTCVKPHIENCSAELYQAAVSTLFIESSSRRTLNGVDWWSYVDKMPAKPLQKSLGIPVASSPSKREEPPF